MKILPIATIDRELTDAEALEFARTSMRIYGEDCKGRIPSIEEVKSSTKLTTHVRDRFTGEWREVDKKNPPFLVVKI